MAGLLTFPALRSSRPRIFGTVTCRLKNLDLIIIQVGITAAGTVRDLHPIPFSPRSIAGTIQRSEYSDSLTHKNSLSPFRKMKRILVLENYVCRKLDFNRWN